MSGARTAVALYVAVALHGVALLWLLLLPSPQSGAGAGRDLGVGLRLEGSDSVLAAPWDEPRVEPRGEPRARPVPPPHRAPRTVPSTPLSPDRTTRPGDANVEASSPATYAAGAALASADTAQDSAVRVTEPAQAGGGGVDHYFARLRAHLYRFRRELPGQLPAARARVSFEVSATGEVSGLRLIESSGLAALDEESIDLLRRASPLPPPPQGRSARLIVPIEIDP